MVLDPAGPRPIISKESIHSTKAMRLPFPLFHPAGSGKKIEGTFFIERYSMTLKDRSVTRAGDADNYVNL